MDMKRVLFLLVLHVAAVTTQNCPQCNGCTCSLVNSWAEMTCNNYQESTLPSCLNSEIHTLIMKGGTFTTWQPGDFSSAPNLRVLDVQESSLETIQAGTFETLTHLDSLRLRNNKIKDVPTDMLKGCTSLYSVDLSYNRIVTIPEFVFTNLTQLSVVDLSHNNINKFWPYTFYGATFTELNLAYNRLYTFTASFLWQNERLDMLDISFNNMARAGYICSSSSSLEFALSWLDASGNSFEDESYKAPDVRYCKHLKVMYLNFYPHGYLTSYAIYSSSLERLYMQNSSVATMSSYAFYMADNLKDVNLSYSTALQQLYLYSNNVPSLQYLDVRGCALPNLGQSGIWDGFGNLMEFIVDDNPFDCEQCNSYIPWMREAMESKPWAHTWKRSMVCDLPNRMKGIPLSELGTLDFQCYKPSVLPPTSFWDSNGDLVIQSEMKNGVPTILHWDTDQYGKIYNDETIDKNKFEINEPRDHSHDGASPVVVYSQLRIKSTAVIRNGPAPLTHTFMACGRNFYYGNDYQGPTGYCNSTTISAPISPTFIGLMVTFSVLLFGVAPAVMLGLALWYNKNHPGAFEFTEDNPSGNDAATIPKAGPSYSNPAYKPENANASSV